MNTKEEILKAKEKLEEARDIFSKIINENKEIWGEHKSWFNYLCQAINSLDLSIDKLEKNE